MCEQRSLAYVNMYAVLKDLEVLCKIDDEAKEIANLDETISISFNVKNGPKGTFCFGKGNCYFREGLGGKIKLKLNSPEAFNKMIDGKKNPFPYGGITKISFVTKDFTKLTGILEKYLKTDADYDKDPEFYKKSTTMLFYLIANAASAVGNYDDIGKIIAKRIPNGSISIGIKEGPQAEIYTNNGIMVTNNNEAKEAKAIMLFEDFFTARGVFTGEVDAMAALSDGKIEMKGFIPMIDNFNKILSRVGNILG